MMQDKAPRMVPLVDGFTRVQDGLHHVEWGCTYISKHNAQSDEQSQEAYSMMAGY